MLANLTRDRLIGTAGRSARTSFRSSFELAFTSMLYVLRTFLTSAAWTETCIAGSFDKQGVIRGDRVGLDLLSLDASL